MAEEDDSKKEESDVGTKTERGRRKKGPLPRLSGGKKKKTARNGLENKILNLIVIVVVAVAIWQFSNQEAEREKQIRVAGQVVLPEQLMQQIPEVDYQGDPRIDILREKQKLDILGELSSRVRPQVKIQTIESGEGAQALCGQSVRYSLLENSEDNPALDEAESLRLGAEADKVGLSLGMIGMRPGEVRIIEVPKDIWQMRSLAQFQQPISTYAVLVKLHTVDDEPPLSNMPLRRFVRASGEGEELRCGDIAIFHTTVWDSNGEKLFSSVEGMPVYFVPGQGQVPFGIEQAVLGIKQEGNYSFVIPQEMLATPAGNASHQFPNKPNISARPWPQGIAWPKNRAVIMDVEYIQSAARAEAIPSSSETEAPEKPVFMPTVQPARLDE